jgi:hypothetical protein
MVEVDFPYNQGTTLVAPFFAIARKIYIPPNTLWDIWKKKSKWGKFIIRKL